MPEPSKLFVNADCSQGMKAILKDPDIAVAIAKNYGAFERVMLQMQLDLSIKGDDEETLQVTKGNRHLQNTLLLFKAQGDGLMASERAE